MQSENRHHLRKLILAALFVAIAFALGGLSIPVGFAKISPAQHFVNVLGAVFLGPVYNVGAAFVTSLLRLAVGTGTVLAFPGSMVGALIAGLLYKYTRQLWAAAIGETFGTGILGALLAYPVAYFVLGKGTLFGFIVPFLISTAAGSILALILLYILKQNSLLERFQRQIDGRESTIHKTLK